MAQEKEKQQGIAIQDVVIALLIVVVAVVSVATILGGFGPTE